MIILCITWSMPWSRNHEVSKLNQLIYSSILTQAQKARIALLYFPLVPLVLSHVDRLNTGCSPYISPMLNATSMAYFSSPRGQSVEPPSLPGSAFSSKYMHVNVLLVHKRVRWRPLQIMVVCNLCR